MDLDFLASAFAVRSSPSIEWLAANPDHHWLYDGPFRLPLLAERVGSHAASTKATIRYITVKMLQARRHPCRKPTQGFAAAFGVHFLRREWPVSQCAVQPNVAQEASLRERGCTVTAHPDSSKLPRLLLVFSNTSLIRTTSLPCNLLAYAMYVPSPQLAAKKYAAIFDI